MLTINIRFNIFKILFIIISLLHGEFVFGIENTEWRELVFSDLSENVGFSVAPGALISPKSKDGYRWLDQGRPLFTVSWTTSSMSSHNYTMSGSCAKETYEYALKISEQKNPTDLSGLNCIPWNLPNGVESATIFGERDIQRPDYTKWSGTIPRQSFVILIEFLLNDVKNTHQDIPISSEKVQTFEQIVNERIGKFSPIRVEMSHGDYSVVMDGLGISLRKKDNAGTYILAQESGQIQNLLSYACAQNSLLSQESGGLDICIRRRISSEDGATKIEERRFSARAAPFWNYLLARFMATAASPQPALVAAVFPTVVPSQPEVDIPATFPAGLNTTILATEKAMAAFSKKYPDMPKPDKGVARIVRLGETLPAFAQKGELIWQVDLFNVANGLYAAIWINPQNPLALDPSVKGADASINAAPFHFILPPIGANPAVVETRK